MLKCTRGIGGVDINDPGSQWPKSVGMCVWGASGCEAPDFDRELMTLWLYRLAFLPLLILSAPYYLLRMRKRGGYGRHFADRFGALQRIPTRRPGVKRLWIQAVSVGELLAIGPLLERLARQSDLEVVLTTTTSTGFKLAEERYGLLVVAIAYFPIDFWFFSARAWKRVQPDLMVLVEGEWWPEHFAQARRRGVPILSINGRLSDRSFRRMRRVRGVIRRLFGGVRLILASSEQDQRRFCEVGFRADQVILTGNLKLDLLLPPPDPNRLEELRQALGFPKGEFVLLGSSTWPGEERAMMAAFRSLRERGMACRLLLVPRHAERREEITRELERTGFTFHLRSKGPGTGLVDILLGDTTGELRRLTQVADLVFVGKSLPPHQGGQTPIEAAAMGKPVLFGPSMSNFRPIAQDLEACHAARVVNNDAELTRSVVELAENDSRRTEMSLAAQRWHHANVGALDRTLALIRCQLGVLEDNKPLGTHE